MESKAKIAGHAIHPSLIVFPLGVLAMAVIFDIISLATHNGDLAQASFYMIAAGFISGLLAAPVGLVDWLSTPKLSRARKIGMWHGIGNGVVLILFGVSWLLRRDNPPDPTVLSLVFSFVGAGLAVVTGWLGGELVERLGVSVDDNANVNAPSSLSHSRARV